MPNYQIIIQGHLDDRWSSWFDGLTITNRADGQAILVGVIEDQAALFRVLLKLRDLGLPLIAVQPSAVTLRATVPTTPSPKETPNVR
jgi:hypothetical protein